MAFQNENARTILWYFEDGWKRFEIILSKMQRTNKYSFNGLATSVPHKPKSRVFWIAFPPCLQLTYPSSRLSKLRLLNGINWKHQWSRLWEYEKRAMLYHASKISVAMFGEKKGCSWQCTKMGVRKGKMQTKNEVLPTPESPSAKNLMR